MPVLAATDINTDFRELIEEAACGYWCESNSPESILLVIQNICSDIWRKKKGINGRKYVEKYFSITRTVNILEDFLETYTLEM